MGYGNSREIGKMARSDPATGEVMSLLAAPLGPSGGVMAGLVGSEG